VLQILCNNKGRVGKTTAKRKIEAQGLEKYQTKEAKKRKGLHIFTEIK
jgi:hypothetical protein